MKGEFFINAIFRKKTLERVLGESGKKTLKPTLRTMDLILLGIGSVIGSGDTGTYRRSSI